MWSSSAREHTTTSRSCTRENATFARFRFSTNPAFAATVDFCAKYGYSMEASANCILVETAGVPTRATRRFVRLLADAQKIPVGVR